MHGRRTGARLPGDIWTFGFFARSEKDNKVHRKRETRQVGIFRCLHVLDVTGIFGALLAIFRCFSAPPASCRCSARLSRDGRGKWARTAPRRQPDHQRADGRVQAQQPHPSAACGAREVSRWTAELASALASQCTAGACQREPWGPSPRQHTTGHSSACTERGGGGQLVRVYVPVDRGAPGDRPRACRAGARER